MQVVFGGVGHHVLHGFGFLVEALEEHQRVLEVFVMQVRILL